jgi:hypothetical protein
MNKRYKKPIMIIFIDQAAIAVLIASAVILIVTLEIPQIDFPKTPWWNSNTPVDYWSDLFLPTIDGPVRFFIPLVMLLNSIGLFLSYLLSKRQGFWWVIGMAITTLISVILIWVNIEWAHRGLICGNESLRNEDLWGCFRFFSLTRWQITIGIFYSLVVFALDAIWGRWFFRRYIL